MSIRAAGTAFLRQERDRHLAAILEIDAVLATAGVSRRKRTVKASRNGTRPVAKVAAKRRRPTKKPVARAANLAAAATGN